MMEKKIYDGKKIINGKSYNVNYDSEKLGSYKVGIDGWAYSKIDVYRKKSTGEYFEYERWSSWNDDWNIKLVEEKKALKILKHIKEGDDCKFVAMMVDFPGEKGTKGGYSFWGKREDDPWEKAHKEKRERKEMLKKARAEQKKKLEQYEQNLKEGKVVDGGEGKAEIYRVEEKFLYQGQWYSNVYVRIVNKDGQKGWHRTGMSIRCGEKDSKADVRKAVADVIKVVEEKYGPWDSVNKGGFMYWSDRNKSMFSEMKKMMSEINK